LGKNEQTNKKPKQTNRKKNTRFRNNTISVLVYVLELLLWHPVLILAYKQKL
jgi:hypothetical protein